MYGLMVKALELVEKFRDLNLQVVLDCDCVRCGMLKVTNIFLNMVKKKQLLDLELCKKKLLRIDKAVEFRLGDDDVLKFKGCV